MENEDGIFERDVSGLIREASLVDATLFGVMNNAVPVSIWLTLTAYAWLPGANLWIAAALTLGLVVFGFAPTWGILGASMPRSGGSYVYNSRILHPAIGVAVSAANAFFVMVAWIWVLAPWIGEVGLPILAGCLGLAQERVEWATRGWGLYAVATLANGLAFLTVMLGMRLYFKVQKVLVSWALIGAAIAGVIFAMTSHSEFVSIWNESFAGSSPVLEWANVVDYVNAEMDGIPEGWNWKATLGMMLPVSWIAIYGYVITFIGGEIHQPRKNIMRAQILNPIVSVGFLVVVTYFFYKMIGWDGLHVVAWMSEEGVAEAELPFKPTYINIASMLGGFDKLLGIVLAGAFIVADWLWVVFSYIAFSRAGFAWGMDRVGPSFFAEVSPKYNQPVKLLTIMFVISQVFLLQYAFSPEILGSISVEVLQLVSVFGITAISAIYFPYSARARTIWRNSQYNERTILGIPTVSIAGCVALTLVVTLTVAYYINESFAFMHTWWTVIYILVWISGILWYLGWRAKRREQGIDIDQAFEEIPPA